MRKLMTITLLLAVAATGCATKKYVRDQVSEGTDPLATRIDGVEGQVEANQTEIGELESGQEAMQGELTGVSKTAQEALTRANDAGKLAEGKFLFETVLADDKVRFGFESSKLSDEAKAAIDEFAAQLKSQNKNVFIEIQGHTDSTGNEAYNEKLGLERANAVRQHLSKAHGIALHRMNVISYGEAEPVADNGDRDGRAQNRRVTLVVLQ
ncbi:MAG: OmpA family protein [Acidobacteriota bacterium]